MKCVVVIGDGVADEPVPALGNRTPLECAFTPNLNFLAQRGQTGLVRCVFDDLPVGSIVAGLAILGYEPHRFFPHGRASFEALASGIRMGPHDLAFRCNLISLQDGTIEDFTANQIRDELAHTLVVGINPENPAIELFPGQSYRNTLIYRNAGQHADASNLVCFPPHEHRGRRIQDLWIRTRDGRSQALCDELNRFQQRSLTQLAELNLEHRSRADMLWLWSPSSAPALPSFRTRYSVGGAVVSGLNFFQGIGLAAQMQIARVPHATGYLDSNLVGKAQAVKDLLESVDVVFVHINAADEEAHRRNVAGKLKAIELIDEVIVGPLARHLRERFPDAFRLAFLPDHYTSVLDGQHKLDPVPYLIYGSGVSPDAVARFDERSVASCADPPLLGWDLLPLLLRPALPGAA